jgi:hypothetical protein
MNTPHYVPNVPPMTAIMPSMEVVQQQTAVNHTIANHIQSWGRRATHEQNAIDAQNINATIAQLQQINILSLPKGLTVYANPPIDILPEKPRKLIYAVAAAFDVPVEMVMACLLAAAFIAARGSFKIRISECHIEMLTAYLIVSAGSGQRKSATGEFFLKVFKDEEAALQRAFAAEGHDTARGLSRAVVKKVEAALAERFADLVAQHGDIEKAETTLADEIADLGRLQKSASKRTAVPRLLANISTSEKLAEEMGLRGEVMGIFDSEGGAITKLLEYPQMMDLYLKAFTGESFASDTKTAGSVHLDCPVLAMCIVAQPNVLEAAYRNEEAVGRGLMPRFLPLFVPYRLAGWNGVRPEIPAELIEWFQELIRGLLRIRLPDPDGTGRVLHILDLNPAAKVEADRYRMLIEQQLRDGWFEQYAAFGSKLVGHAVRLAGAVHLLKVDDPQKHMVDGETMACGVALAEFFRAHAAAAFTPEARDGVAYGPKILKWIRRHRPWKFAERDAQRGVGRINIVQLRAGLDQLERHNYVRSLITSAGRTYVVHPGAFSVF